MLRFIPFASPLVGSLVGDIQAVIPLIERHIVNPYDPSHRRRVSDTSSSLPTTFTTNNNTNNSYNSNWVNRKSTLSQPLAASMTSPVVLLVNINKGNKGLICNKSYSIQCSHASSTPAGEHVSVAETYVGSSTSHTPRPSVGVDIKAENKTVKIEEIINVVGLAGIPAVPSPSIDYNNRQTQETVARGECSTAPITPRTGAGVVSDKGTSTNTSDLPDADNIAQMLRDPYMARKVVEQLSERTRRQLVMRASNKEWLADNNTNEAGKTLEQRPPNSPRTGACSTTASHVMTASEYRLWATHAQSVRRLQEANEAISSGAATTGTEDVKLSFRVLARIAIQTACPFVAFGLLDNSLMIFAGDIIETNVGDRFRMSTMAAAALGGVVSGTLGIQMHGLAERLVQKFGPPRPKLAPGQWRNKSVRRAMHIGGTVGIVVGLTLGMYPLLFKGAT